MQNSTTYLLPDILHKLFHWGDYDTCYKVALWEIISWVLELLTVLVSWNNSVFQGEAFMQGLCSVVKTGQCCRMCARKYGSLWWMWASGRQKRCRHNSCLHCNYLNVMCTFAMGTPKTHTAARTYFGMGLFKKISTVRILGCPICYSTQSTITCSDITLRRSVRA